MQASLGKARYPVRRVALGTKAATLFALLATATLPSSADAASTTPILVRVTPPIRRCDCVAPAALFDEE